VVGYEVRGAAGKGEITKKKKKKKKKKKGRGPPFSSFVYLPSAGSSP